MVRRLFSWVLLAAVGGSAFGQTAEQSIAARLQHGPFVLLRGMYAGDRLNFDAQGNLTGSADMFPFSLSAIVVDKIHLSDKELTIEGRHASLEFDPVHSTSQPSRIRAVAFSRKLHPDITITVARDDAHPEWLDAAVGKVFAVGFDQSVANSAPWYWRRWLLEWLQGDFPAQSAPPGVLHVDPKAGISAPFLRYAPDPEYSIVAKDAQFNGMCVVGVVVDEHGMPRNPWIVRPVGYALDEEALAAISKYRFKPAMKQGQPVPVAVNIQVNFRIW